MKLSVIIPTYGKRSSLKEAISSLSVESMNDVEVIVINNDQSTDSRAFIEKIIEGLPNIKVFDAPENLGPGRGRNMGALKAKGDIIAFIDDDCVADSGWIESILAAFEENKNLKVGYGLVYSDIPPNRPFIHAFEMYGQAFGSGNSFFKRDYFLKIGGFDSYLNTWAEDFEIGARCERNGEKPIYYDGIRVNHPPKIFNLTLKNLIYGFEFLDKYFYITDFRNYQYKENLFLKAMKGSIKKITFSIPLIAFALIYSPQVLLLIPVFFFILKTPIIAKLKRAIKDYDFNEELNWKRVYWYCLTYWLVDLLNLNILVLYKIVAPFREPQYKRIKRPFYLQSQSEDY